MPSERSDLSLFTAKMWIATFFLLGFTLVFFLRFLLLLTFLSLLLAVFWLYFADGIQRLGKSRLPRNVVVILAMLLSFGFFVLFGFFLYAPIEEQAREFFTDLPNILRNAWMRLQPVLRRFGLGDLQPMDLAGGGGKEGEGGGGVVKQGLTILSFGFETVSSLIAVLFLAFFWATQPELYRKGFIRMLPATMQPWGEQALTEIASTLRQWMKATGLSMLSISILTTIMLYIAGLPYALLFGAAAGIFDLIPFLGPTLAFIGPALISLTISPTLTLWILLGWLIIQTVEANVVVPYFMAREAELPPAIMIFAVFAMGTLFGFLGVFLAAPATAVIMAVVRTAYSAREFPKSNP